MVCGGSFHLPHDLFRPTLVYNIHFSLPVTICFKNETFSLRFSRESHAEIPSRRFFSLMWNPNVKSIYIIKLVQMIFSTWFGYFEYVGYLPCGMMLISINVSIWLLSTSTGLPDHGVLSSKKISSMKLQKPLLTHSISHSTFSIHCTNLFLCVSVEVLPFLK